MRLRPENPGNLTVRASEHPLKIHVVFDDDVSARSAEVLIKHMTSGFECDRRSFAFDDLHSPGCGLAAARSAFDTDILVVAVRDDHTLPAYVQSWLDLYLRIRDRDREGSLVVLIAKAAETADPNSSLSEYLKTVAGFRELAYFPGRQSVAHVSASDHPVQQRLPWAGSNSNSHIRGLARNRVTARLNNE